MKNLVVFLSFIFTYSLSVSQNWEFVGPRSSNLENVNSLENNFETGQLNWIVQNPNNENHFFAGGKFAGLWESFDGCESWNRINTFQTGSGGIAYCTFIDNSKILIGTHFNDNRTSSKCAIYNFINDTWIALSDFPNPNNSQIVVKDVDVDLANINTFYISTSVGLFRGVLSGTSITWTNVQSGCIENMEILPVILNSSSKVTYRYYIAGSQQPTSGTQPSKTSSLLYKQSTNGTLFTDIVMNFNFNTNTYNGFHGYLCKGNSNSLVHEIYIKVFCNRVSNNKLDLFIYRTVPTSGDPNQILNLLPNGYSNSLAYDRTAMIYDPINDGVYFGAVKLNFVKDNGILTTNIRPGSQTIDGKIHDDMHDFKIYNLNNQPYLFVAHDGGIAMTSIPNTGNLNESSWYFHRKNKNLDVMLVHGFSGATENPNIYAVGGMDIVNLDIFDHSTLRNVRTLTDGNNGTWENDGALIDKFNNQNIIIDRSTYNHHYLISNDGGQSTLIKNLLYNPYTDAPFRVNLQSSIPSDKTGGQNFIGKQFFQDPFRPNRIFYGKRVLGLFQLDQINNCFVRRIDLADVTPIYGQWSNGWAIIKGASFSPETPNSMHIIVNGTVPDEENTETIPMVIKYIGDNLDDCWPGHNMNTSSTGQLQWQNLTGNIWQNLTTQVSNCNSCVNLNSSNMYMVNFHEIETSPWNKNIIYVAVTVPNNPSIQILKYNGTVWSNYSTGIPSGEIAEWMTMDYGSNDALYITTTNGKIYYRNATMSSWINYNDSNFPIIKTSQVEINYKENTVRVGTYGQGIWKSTLVCPTVSNPINNSLTSISANIYEGINMVALRPLNQISGPTAFRATNSIVLNPGFFANGQLNANRYFKAFIHGCNTSGSSDGLRNATGVSAIIDSEIDEDDLISKKYNQFNIHPNPSNGVFNITFDDQVDKCVIKVFTVNGVLLDSLNFNNSDNCILDLSSQPVGSYLIQVEIGSNKMTKRIVKI